MFPTIRTINDVLPFIATKKEISRIPGPAGSTTICYQFQDSETFDTPQARECRGIVFDRGGNIAARPLHKFFNLGEHGEEFAMQYREHQLFALLMPAYNGKTVNYAGWYRRNHLKGWSLNPVGEIALDDA